MYAQTHTKLKTYKNIKREIVIQLVKMRALHIKLCGTVAGNSPGGPYRDSIALSRFVRKMFKTLKPFKKLEKE